MNMQITARQTSALIIATLFTIQVAAARGPILKTERISSKTAGIGSGRPIASDRYTIIAIPLPKNDSSIAFDINERGLVTGVYDVILEGGAKRESTFVWNGKELVTIEYPGAQYTSVPGINASGNLLYGNWGSFTQQTAGYYDLKQNTFSAIDPMLNKPLNFIVRANDAGVALGYSCEGDFDFAFNCLYWLWDGKVFRTLQLPEQQPFNFPTYINNRGQVVGFSAGPAGIMGFINEGGVNTWLYPPGITTNEYIPRAISNSGIILGSGETDPSIFWQPFFYDHGLTKLLPEYGPEGQTNYFGMNERGDLAGSFFTGPTTAIAIVAYRNK
jgi:hypothetical protein